MSPSGKRRALFRQIGLLGIDAISMISVGRVFNSGSIFQPTVGRGLLYLAFIVFLVFLCFSDVLLFSVFF